jgi:hypothetical protein
MNPQLIPGLVLLTTLVGCATSSPADRARSLPDGVLTPVAQESAPSAPPRARAADARDRAPWELFVAGAGGSNSDLDAGGAQAVAAIGYHFNDIVELSVRQNGSYADAGETSPEIWNGASRAAIDLHIPIGRFVPYAGANFGYAYGDTIRDSMMAGPEAGVKIYLQDDAFLLVGAEYEFFFDKGDSLQTAFDDGQFLYTIGMGMRL